MFCVNIAVEYYIYKWGLFAVTHFKYDEIMKYQNIKKICGNVGCSTLLKHKHCMEVTERGDDYTLQHIDNLIILF